MGAVDGGHQLRQVPELLVGQPAGGAQGRRQAHGLVAADADGGLGEIVGEDLSAQKPEAADEVVVPVDVPVERGLPHPESPSRLQFNSSGLARSIVQDGWDITYSDYFDTAQPVLPRRLQLASDELTLKLVIERWQREQAPADKGDAGLFPSFD